MYHWAQNWHDGAEFVDATFENAAIGIAHVGLDGSWLRVNERLLEIVGYGRDELLSLTFQDITHPDDLETDLTHLEQLIAGEIRQYQMEKRYFRKDGGQIWINLTVGLQRDSEGKPAFCISLVEDITQRKTDEQHLRILIDELNHRVKNTLATVQAVAHMSFRDDQPIIEAKRDFTSRLQAISSAHDLLTDEKWTGANIAQIIDRALAPFSLVVADRISAKGCKVRLTPRQALVMAMAINELTTNAIKYGALSAGDGIVSVSWGREGKGANCELWFEWAESGGPKCRAPDRTGFGSTLLARILPGDFSGEASLDYAESGLSYKVSAPWPTDIKTKGGRV